MAGRQGADVINQLTQVAEKGKSDIQTLVTHDTA
jgi:hypothetical protein